MINKGSDKPVDVPARRRFGGRFGILAYLCVIGGFWICVIGGGSWICVIGGLWSRYGFQNAPPQRPDVLANPHHDTTLAEVVELRARAESMVARFNELQKIDAEYKPMADDLAMRMRKATALFESRRYDAAYSVYRGLLAEGMRRRLSRDTRNAHPRNTTLAEVAELRARVVSKVARFNELQKIDAEYKPMADDLAMRMRKATALFESRRYDAACSVYLGLLKEYEMLPGHGTNQSAKTPTTNPAGKPTTRQREEIISGEKLLKAWWSWDIDSNSDRRERIDVYWHHVTESERYLVPQNGAGLAVVRGKEYKELSQTDLMKIKFSKHRISVSYVNSLIDAGAVLAIKTSEGNFAKLQVLGFSPLEYVSTKYNIRLRYVLYRK